ncbi:MFS transporter [Xenorhabdus szentirmaii]|uniref:MFS transporter n=1 Tax=Xenorhabdus szentirmaii TaxID=290112 RepID=A0AAW3YTW9_9GAMM|nr:MULTISPECIES: MFS transporter [unclassified Xenorhabdus]MBD2781422.1 MFS transporter [Xenorhabdus sp. 38]MBD2800509.1 MFS transporter [Xenorhabdus sp. M]MBD2805291.1 MFS transporter [Xenorhabdus sp. ZM]
MPPYIVSSKIIPPLVLPIFSLTVFFIGAMEFMLSPMLNPLAEAFKTTTEKATWLVSGYAFAYACTAPIFGWLSDRINRRKLLLISLFFLSFDGLALTIAPNLEIAIGLRLFGGMASAALIPTIFALIADIFPSHKQASAMGIVMLGMTAGIVGGPMVAGVLTELCHWRLPFWVNAAGCLLLFFLILNKQGISRPANAGMKKEKTSISFQWIRQGNLLRPLLAKGCWNGTAVSAFILSGEILRQHYGLGTGVIGISVSAFGIGLGLGNLAVSMLKRLSVNKERALLWAIVFILLTSSAFISISFSLCFSLACLMLWGCALGFAAPVSTSILTERAENNKGQILAVSESLNNLVILLLIPAATLLLARYGTAVTMVMLGSCLMIGIGLTIRDLNR